jgi:hypothetical protein
MFWLLLIRKIVSFKPVIRTKEDSSMMFRAVFGAAGCLIAWFVVLPVVAVLGGAALFLYAALAETTSLITGYAPRTIDASAIRVTARRICRA